MANTTSSTLTTSNAAYAQLVHAYLLTENKPKLYLYQRALKASAAGSSKYKFNIADRIDLTIAEATVGTEWLNPTAKSFSLTTKEVTPTEYVSTVQISNRSMKIASERKGILKAASKTLKGAFERLYDLVIQNTINASSSYKFYSKNSVNAWAGSRALIPAGADGQASLYQLSVAQAYLDTKAAEGDKVAFYHPSVWHDVRTQAWPGFTLLEIKKYTEDPFNGEIGKFGNIRVVLCPTIAPLTTTGGVGGTQTIYPTYIIAEDAIGVGEWSEMEVLYASGADKFDSADLWSTVSVKGMFGSTILKDQNLFIIESNCSLSFSY